MNQRWGLFWVVVSILCTIILADSIFTIAPRAVGTTWYFDIISGNDTHDCHTDRTQACKTWGKFIALLNAGTIAAGDTALFRPGRYPAQPSGGSTATITGAGGTSGAHITISVDTFYSGNVEIDGSLAPGPTTVNGITASNFTNWAQAEKCSGGTVRGISTTNTPCDTDADCSDVTTTTAGTALCQPITNVYFTRTSGNHNDTTGNTPGYVFQPGANPGDTPKFFEILYSPPSTPITVPAFTAGHDQVWVYTERAATCRAAGSPWVCCTGSGAGATCAGSTGGAPPRNQRVYVQTATNARPDLVSPPVEVPFGAFSIAWFNRIGSPTQYLDFTNNDNGRTFYFWHAMKSLMYLKNVAFTKFQNADFAYNDFITAPSPGVPARGAWIDSGSGWPRNSGGSMYLIMNGSPVTAEHHNTWKNGIAHYSGGDEIFHLTFGTQVESGACATSPTCGSGVCSNNAAVSCSGNNDCLGAECTSTTTGGTGECNTTTGLCHYAPTGDDNFTNFNIDAASWATPNGQQPNSATVACTWPPHPYQDGDGLVTGWGSIYFYCSAIGGGGQSGNCGIVQSPHNTITGGTHSNCTGWSWENPNENTSSGFNYGETINGLTFDAQGLKDRADANGTLFPAGLVSSCDGGPAGPACNGFSGGYAGIIGNPSFSFPGAPGNVIKNSLIKNGYGEPLSPGFKAALLSPPSKRANAIINNTIELKGNATHVTIDGQVSMAFGFGSSGLHGVFKNNIVVSPSGTVTSNLALTAALVGLVDFDYNDYGAGFKWHCGSNGVTSTFATWTGQCGGETHSQQADPLLDANYLIPGNSPAKDAGTDLTSLGVTTDEAGTSRPQGPAFDEGWFEVVLVGTTTTSSSTSSTSSTSTTSTSIQPKFAQGFRCVGCSIK